MHWGYVVPGDSTLGTNSDDILVTEYQLHAQVL
jgi:hypothetical protein